MKGRKNGPLRTLFILALFPFFSSPVFSEESPQEAFEQINSCLQKSSDTAIGYATVEANILNMRSQPVKGKNVVKKLQRNEFLAVVRQRGEWSNVLDASCDTGWVANAYLKKSTPDAKLELKNIMIYRVADALEFAVVTNVPVRKYHYFLEKNPHRLVIDLIGKWGKVPYRSIKNQKDWIDSVTLERHQDKLRLTAFLRVDGMVTVRPKKTASNLVFAIQKGP